MSDCPLYEQKQNTSFLSRTYKELSITLKKSSNEVLFYVFVVQGIGGNKGNYLIQPKKYLQNYATFISYMCIIR